MAAPINETGLTYPSRHNKQILVTAMIREFDVNVNENLILHVPISPVRTDIAIYNI